MDIRVPTLAEGVESGTVVAVLVSEGDQVQKDQTIVELETNKAVATIPATEAGTVSKVHVKEGDMVPVGGLLVTVGGEGGGDSSTATSAPEAAPAPTSVAPAAPAANVSVAAPVAAPTGGAYQYHSPSGSPPPASPSVRKFARELGIDLTRVQGTENGGRITIGDLRNYVAYLQQLASQSTPAAVAAPAAASGKSAPVSVDFSKWGPVTKKPMTQLRKTISEAMVNSWTTIPHVTQFDDISLDSVMALRKKLLSQYEKEGVRLTVTSFIIKAVANTLEKHPLFNSSIDEATKEVVTKEYIHIGIAVDTEQGLMVPVIRDVNQKSILDISKDLAELAEKTRSRKVSIEEMQGGSFTISNQGGIGGRHFTPIVNKPEVAILGLGKAGLQPVVDGTKIGKSMMMPVALSYDHRLIDGGSAARFVVDLVDAIENFDGSGAELKKTSKKASKKKGKK